MLKVIYMCVRAEEVRSIRRKKKKKKKNWVLWLFRPSDARVQFLIDINLRYIFLLLVHVPALTREHIFIIRGYHIYIFDTDN
jgi:hypothetical protein